MRQVRYAGGEFFTTDEIANVLLRLTWGLSGTGQAEIVEVPVVTPNEPGASETAQLVITASSEMLSLPARWEGEEPDFSSQAMMLQMLPDYPRSVGTPAAAERSLPSPLSDGWDPEFGDW